MNAKVGKAVPVFLSGVVIWSAAILARGEEPRATPTNVDKAMDPPLPPPPTVKVELHMSGQTSSASDPGGSRGGDLSLGAETAPDLPLSREAFGAASTREKRGVLNGITVHDVELPSADMVVLVRSGLLDAESEVRATALNAVAARASGPFWAGAEPPAFQEKRWAAWLADKPVIEELRPVVRTLLDDPDAKVRYDAVRALNCMDFDVANFEARRLRLSLSEPTVTAFAERYAREPTAHVRDVILKSFALGQEDSPAVRQTILAAMDDPDRHVRESAMQGAQRLKLDAAWRTVTKRLRDPDAQVRFFAANALAFYCETAECLSALEAALATETDPDAREEMARAVAVLKQKQ